MSLVRPDFVFRGRALLLALLVASAAIFAVGQARPALAVAGTCSFAQASYTIVEGQNVIVTVNRAGGTDLTNANYTVAGTGGNPATPGTHISPFAGAITVFQNQSSGQTTFTTLDDGGANAAREATITLVPGGAGDCTPAGQITTVVTITDNDGPQPATITSISPHSGTTAGGTIVAITGTNFTGTACPGGVTFGGTASAACVVNNSTSITATAPAKAAGTYDISVNNGNGASPNTANDDFTYGSGPIVTNVSPSSAPAGVTTANVTITGTGFGAGSTVTVGGTTATVTNTAGVPTSLVVTVPAKTAGTYDVIVTETAVQSPNTADDNFTYTGTVPSVSSLSPSSGGIAGGNSVTINGSNFTGATSVTFGAVVIGSGSFISSGASFITVTAPAVGFAQVVNVSVTTPSGTSSTVGTSDDYTYTIAPNITSLNPTSGSSAGGNSVVITGTGFLGVTSVTFGGTSATFTVNNATQITATAPAKPAGAYDVAVTNASGTSPNTAADDYTYTGGPTITSVTPNTGPIGGGTIVSIVGTGFTGATAVKFGGTNATTFTVLNSTTITATTPAHSAGTVDVTVTTPAGTNPNTSADDFIYGNAPSITSLTPSTGPTAGGTTVTITGINLLGVTAVTFGGTNATSFTVHSNTTITASTPPHAAGTVDTRVTNASGTSANTAADDFTYTGGPAITLVVPNNGSSAGGTTVTLTGVGFTGATSVTVGGKSASFTVNSDTKITLTTPSGTAGSTVDIRVTTPAGTSANTGADDFTYSGGTFSYTLYFRWNLLVWQGQNGINADTAVQGGSGLSNVSSIVTSILRWNASQQKWETFFPGKANVPGANDFTTLENGRSYWVAVTSSTGWTIGLP